MGAFTYVVRCDCGLSFDTGAQSEAAAADRWNERPAPDDVVEARETLASQLCEKLAHDRGAPIAWAEAIEIVATITHMPAEEKARLLAMDDSADQECAHSEANNLGCPECGEEFTHPAPVVEAMISPMEKVAAMMDAKAQQEWEQHPSNQAAKLNGAPK